MSDDAALSAVQLPFQFSVNIPKVLRGREYIRSQVPGTNWSIFFFRKAGTHGAFVAEHAPVAIYGHGLLCSRVEIDEFGNLLKEIPGWRPNQPAP